MPRDLSLQVQFRGKITSGRGQATSDLRSTSEELQSIVAKPLYPGSLNVILRQPVRLLESAGFTFDHNRRMVWPASLNGLEVWIYRWREAPLHIVEVLAPIHLRNHLKLKDGDEITVGFNENQVEAVNALGKLVWGVIWLGRRNWSYSKDKYYVGTMTACTTLGAAQQQPTIKGSRQMSMYVAKAIIKRTPLVGTLAKKVKSRIRRGEPGQRYTFSRLNTEELPASDERLHRQILNVLNFTKTSNSAYAALDFPAAYHTIDINGRRVQGQRDPAKRLALVPVDFRGKTLLDIGCNQGGMIHEVSDIVKWAVGIDYDSRMINAANRVRSATGANNTNFYVLDLQKDPLELISDFLPEAKVDICFLLSVCMWLDNWRDVIDFAQTRSRSMLFETNGTPIQQSEQVQYLNTKYGNIQILSETSEDDPTQKERSLYFLTTPIA